MIQISDILAALAGADDFEVDLPIPDGLDPFGAEYRAVVLNHYRQITGRPYDMAYELHTPTHNGKLYPYTHGNPLAVARQLIGTGHIIKTLLPKPGQRVLEMGAGIGHLAVPLAKLGCEVTALEIDPAYVDVLARRSEREDAPMRILHRDFLSIADMRETFDLVVFCSCLHHTPNHLDVLRLVHERLALGGRVALCGEPIDENLRYPWTLTYNRAGILQMVQDGWFESSYKVSYLMAAVQRAGFRVPSLHVCQETAFGNVLLAEHG
jgi:2-polyprenyl-3-methyl-5-hydroxy-6-metoxy-1,4-benzoquinol methylase